MVMCAILDMAQCLRGLEVFVVKINLLTTCGDQPNKFLSHSPLYIYSLSLYSSPWLLFAKALMRSSCLLLGTA
jgi:hypothetical protein